MKKKIRILHVVVNMGHGGYENYLMNIMRKLDRERFEFNFLIFKSKEAYFEKEIVSLGGKVFHCSFSDDFRYVKARKQLKKIAEENSFDILHFHTHYYSFLVLPIFKKKVKQIIVHSHNSSVEKTLKGRIVWVLSHYTSKKKYNNLACSKVAGDFLFGKNGKYELCPNCIDSIRFLYDQEASRVLRQKYNIPDNAYVIGHVGRFIKQKNHPFILETFKKLLSRNDNCKLCLCGIGVNKERIIKQVSEDKMLKDNVIFLEPGDVTKYYSLFDCFVLPSFSEGFPLSLLESQAAGCFSLASDTITNEVELTDKIKYLSIKSTDLWVDEIEKQMKASSYDRKLLNKVVANCQYDSDNATKFLENYYERLMEGNDEH